MCHLSIVYHFVEVVRRVMNAKNRFRGFGRGAAKSQQFTNILSQMTKESEENSKKKAIAEQARVDPANLK